MKNLGDQLQVIELGPVASLSATGNGTGIDVTQFAEQLAIVVDAHNVSGSTPTLDVKLQDSATLGGTYADIASAAITQVTTVDSAQKIVLNRDTCKQFIRAVHTLGGSSPVYLVSIKAYGIKKYPA